MAKSFLKQIKDHLEKNQSIKDIFGDFSSKGAESWREDSITLSQGDTVGYRGKEPTVSVAGCGTNVVGTHFTFALLDDLVNRDNINTMDRMLSVIDFYKDVLDLIDPVGGRKQLIVIGTTWHQADLYSWIQDPRGSVAQDFKVLCMPAYTGEWGEGELLFPTRLGWRQLEELKTGQQDSVHFSAQYMLDPVPPASALFKPPFKYYEESDLRGLPLTKFMAVDPAISQRKEADYSAIVVVGVDKNNTWYILDIWREKVDPKQLIDRIFLLDMKYDPVQIGVEANSFQQILQFYIREEMKKRNNPLPIKELIHNETSKDERIRGLQPKYALGSVFHDRSNENTKFLEDELKRFPKGKHDDIIDALASILEIAHPPRVKEKRSFWRGSTYPA